MSRKTTPSRPKRSTAGTRSGKTATPAKTTASSGKKSTRTASAKSPAPKKGKGAKSTVAKGKSTGTGAEAPSPAKGDRAASAGRQMSPAEVLLRAEADVTTAIETLNAHMNAALNTFVELASVHHGRGKAVVRTAPLDRATAAFQRLVAEVVDEHLAEILPPLAELRNEIAQRANHDASAPGENHAFYEHGSQTLDHVLSVAGARAYEAQAGESFDPLIHLAVGETSRPELADGVVAECIQPGFRSARGKVLVPAKVKVNRR